MLERLAALDIAVFKAVHQGLWGTPWLAALRVIQLAGEGAGLAALFVFAFLIAPPGRRLRSLLRVAVPTGVACLACEVLKKIVNVERPKTLCPELVLDGGPDLPKHLSWPSGHTTAVFAFATAVLLLRVFDEMPPRRWTAASVFAFFVAAVTGLARIAVGAHFPADVLSGAILGVSVAHLTASAMTALYVKSASRH